MRISLSIESLGLGLPTVWLRELGANLVLVTVDRLTHSMVVLQELEHHMGVVIAGEKVVGSVVS